ncbi:unnamed protein product, partial [Discosporangium mesarthrocarpum]
MKYRQNHPQQQQGQCIAGNPLSLRLRTLMATTTNQPLRWYENTGRRMDESHSFPRAYVYTPSRMGGMFKLQAQLGVMTCAWWCWAVRGR